MKEGSRAGNIFMHNMTNFKTVREKREEISNKKWILHNIDITLDIQVV